MCREERYRLSRRESFKFYMIAQNNNFVKIGGGFIDLSYAMWYIYYSKYYCICISYLK